MKKILFSLFLLLGSLFVFNLNVYAKNDIKSIDMDIYVDKNGNASITETWVANFDSGTEGYKPYYNLGASEITNFSVTMDEVPFTFKDYWNTSSSFDEKAYSNGLNYTSNSVEICFGVSKYGTHTYRLNYTITNFVASLNDSDMIYWTLIPYELSDKPGNVNIEIYTDDYLDKSIEVWGYGNYGGLAYVSDGRIYMSSEGVLESNEYMTILVKFPKGIFQSSNVIDDEFDTYLNMANEGAKKYEVSLSEKIENIVILILPFLIFGVVFIVVAIQLIKASGTKKLGIKTIYIDKYLPKDIPYFREIPTNNNIDQAYWLSTLYALNEKNTDVLGSYLLDWIRKGFITVQKRIKDGLFKDKEEQVLIFKPLNEVTLEGKSLELYQMFLESTNDNILEPKEFEKWCSKNYEKFFSWFDDLLDSVSLEFEKNNLLSKKTYKRLCFNITNDVIDNQLFEEAKKLQGLKKFLNDFSSIKDRSAIEVNLWQEYLIYAQIFGIAEKVAKEFKRLYPEVVTDVYYDNVVFVSYISVHSFSSANSARSRARSYSAGGGGFSAGGGGGGSFGGGGGGGGVR